MKYKVIIDSVAEQDIISILHYITDILKAPDAANRLYAKMVESILSLSESPHLCRLIEEEPYKSKGVRMLLIDNYIAFFFVDEDREEVHVFRVLYGRREWQALLWEFEKT